MNFIPEPVGNAHDYATSSAYRTRAAGPIPHAKNPHGWNTPMRIGSKKPRMEKLQILLAKWDRLAPESKKAIEKDYEKELKELRQ